MVTHEEINQKADKTPQINSVLVVDDDDNWCFVTKRMLEKAGICKRVFTANNGRKALDFLTALQAQEDAQIPELILLDIKMPVMDGFEFLEEINNLKELNLTQTQIYICTSSFLPKDKEKANQYPIAGFLTKPLNTDVLKSIVN